MKKLIAILLLSVLLTSTGWAQYAAWEVGQTELFSTQICTLGGINTDFVNNPNVSTDSTFAYSNTISMLIPAPRFAGDKTKVFANRAWLEVEVVDTGSTAGAYANDSLIVFVFAVGPDGGASNRALDTLCFVVTTGAINKPEMTEISPYGFPKHSNSAVLTRIHALDQSGLALGDSLVLHTDHLPIALALKIVGDCSTTTLVPTTPWCNAYTDSVMIAARMILEFNQSGTPGW